LVGLVAVEQVVLMLAQVQEAQPQMVVVMEQVDHQQQEQ
jgi:1-deoxy-D-xylulose 5-phosphate reductoisomerase